MVRKLNSTVHVHNGDGTVTVYGPGDKVSAADTKLITNPKAWDGADADDSATTKDAKA